MKNQDILVILDERITEIARAIVQEAIANDIAQFSFPMTDPQNSANSWRS